MKFSVYIDCKVSNQNYYGSLFQIQTFWQVLEFLGERYLRTQKPMNAPFASSGTSESYPALIWPDYMILSNLLLTLLTLQRLIQYTSFSRSKHLEIQLLALRCRLFGNF